MYRFLLLALGLVSLAQQSTALRGSTTRVYSSKEDGGHNHEDHAILKEMSQYELHDFSSILNHARRRLSDSDEHVMDLQVFGRSLQVTLKKDTDFFRPGYKHSFLDENGNEVKSEGPLDCIYRATLAEGVSSGSFALCDESRVLATVFGDTTFTIEPIMVKQKGRSLEELVHAVYLHDDLKENPANMTRMVFPPAREAVPPTALRGVDDGFTNAVATPYTDSKMKYVGLLQVNDNAFYKKYGGNTHVKAAQLISAANSYYNLLPSTAPYRIRLDLSQMATFMAKDPYTASYSDGKVNDQALLTTFGSWLQSTDYQVDAAHLYVGTKFQAAAGWGYVGTVCDRDNRWNVGETDGTMSDASASMVAAHEIGHVLGAQHDDVTVPGWNTNCNDNRGIMGRRLQSTDRFSTCTIEWFRLQFAPTSQKYNNNYNPACLERVDYDTPSGAVCGDGLVQGDEECDCVGKDCSANPCCDGSTCRLKTGATCSAHEGCCDPNTCRPRSAGFTCRAASGQCDVAEECNGQSSVCPADARTAIGTPCSRTSSGAAVTGTCTCAGCMSHDQKCRSSSPNYIGACPFLSSGDAMCDVIWCQETGGGCSGFLEPTGAGLACGPGKACMNKACVANSNVDCPGVVFTSPPTTATTTRSPTKAPVVAPVATNAPVAAPVATKAPVAAPVATKAPITVRLPTRYPTRRRRRRGEEVSVGDELFVESELGGLQEESA